MNNYRLTHSHAVNECGKLNLNTAKCKYFNILEEWKDYTMDLCLFKSCIDGSFIVIASSGKFVAKSPHITFFNSQTLRYIHNGHSFDLVCEEQMSAAELEKIKKLVDNNSVPFFTLD